VVLSSDSHGEITIGGGELWRYIGQPGELLTISVAADRLPSEDADSNLGLDTRLILYDSQGNWLQENDDGYPVERGRTNSQLSYTVPADGVLMIEVRSYADESGGGYTLIIELRG